jgi:hypothetical protein
MKNRQPSLVVSGEEPSWDLLGVTWLWPSPRRSLRHCSHINAPWKPFKLLLMDRYPFYICVLRFHAICCALIFYQIIVMPPTCLIFSDARCSTDLLDYFSMRVAIQHCVKAGKVLSISYGHDTGVLSSGNFTRAAMVKEPTARILVVSSWL